MSSKDSTAARESEEGLEGQESEEKRNVDDMNKPVHFEERRDSDSVDISREDVGSYPGIGEEEKKKEGKEDGESANRTLVPHSESPQDDNKYQATRKPPTPEGEEIRNSTLTDEYAHSQENDEQCFDPLRSTETNVEGDTGDGEKEVKLGREETREDADGSLAPDSGSSAHHDSMRKPRAKIVSRHQRRSRKLFSSREEFEREENIYVARTLEIARFQEREKQCFDPLRRYVPSYTRSDRKRSRHGRGKNCQPARRTIAPELEPSESCDSLYRYGATSVPTLEVPARTQYHSRPASHTRRFPGTNREGAQAAMSNSDSEAHSTGADDETEFASSGARPPHLSQPARYGNGDIYSRYSPPMMLSPSGASPRKNCDLHSPAAAFEATRDFSAPRLKSRLYAEKLDALSATWTREDISAGASVSDELSTMHATFAAARETMREHRVSSAWLSESGGEDSVLEGPSAGRSIRQAMESLESDEDTEGFAEGVLGSEDSNSSDRVRRRSTEMRKAHIEAKARLIRRVAWHEARSRVFLQNGVDAYELARDLREEKAVRARLQEAADRDTQETIRTLCYQVNRSERQRAAMRKVLKKRVTCVDHQLGTASLKMDSEGKDTAAASQEFSGARASAAEQEPLAVERLRTVECKIARLAEETHQIRKDLEIEKRARAAEGDVAAARTGKLEYQLNKNAKLAVNKECARNAECQGADEIAASLRDTVSSLQLEVGALKNRLAEEEALRCTQESAHSMDSAKDAARIAELNNTLARTIRERDAHAAESAATAERFHAEACKTASLTERAASVEEGVAVARQLSAAGREATEKAGHAERALAELRTEGLAEKRYHAKREEDAVVVVSGLKTELAELKSQAALLRQTSAEALARETQRTERATAKLAVVSMETERLRAAVTMEALAVDNGVMRAESNGQLSSAEVTEASDLSENENEESIDITVQSTVPLDQAPDGVEEVCPRVAVQGTYVGLRSASGDRSAQDETATATDRGGVG